MKITKTQLKQIIKEEIGRLFEQDAQGYKAIVGPFGVLRFFDRKGNQMNLDYEELMQSAEKLPGFEEIVDVDAYNDLKDYGGGTIPDHDQLVDQGGFIEDKTIQDLLDLYIDKGSNPLVLAKALGLNPADYPALDALEAAIHQRM